ncbi:hypothetical protein A2886_01265 [candidate division WWE3 bacterium RIFCSPHIGHO2_01_FULL_42_13]|uniref:Large ribosomal subunit protein uL29 n=1 Tax=candidate division WWE3 bacterium RIFCSPHIGHO2_01_FULL_42_13 TaxID=1802617 RepID=A0A1F4UQK4_UNCKA|nr:MAG: hypothetical protein A2886_01265 [candidate division WWE3 bacterium RIFCSPHIGHO2_01_FULL_42_13]
MKKLEIKEKTEKDLTDMLKKAKDVVEKTISEIFQGKSKDTSKVKKVRRELARIQTALNKKGTKENA